MNMNRRETLKSLLLAPLGAGIASAAGCAGGGRLNWAGLPREYSYGRTAAERQRDRELFAQSYFSQHELATIATLCDIILPSDHPNGGALDAGLPDFVEFIAKDMGYLKTPARDGIAWLDNHAIDACGADFIGITEAQRLAICDRIAWPDVEDPALQAGIRFFSLMRDLTLTGYYTTAQGFRGPRLPGQCGQRLGRRAGGGARPARLGIRARMARKMHRPVPPRHHRGLGR